MKKCAVIGGGFAGLSAAVHLLNAGYNVELFEGSRKLGGRAYSFKDDETGDVIDNGQHIMMGCYKNTIELLKIIGSGENLSFQKNLSINFMDKVKGEVPLTASPAYYPVNLLLAILRYDAIPFIQRINIVRLFLKLKNSADIKNDFTIYDWLIDNNQGKESIKAFWEIIAVGALNTGIKKASAKIFIHVLKEIFLNGNDSASIILPSTDLSKMYCENACEFIISREGKINLSCYIEKVVITGDKAISLVSGDTVLNGYDYIISAIPAYALEKIIPKDYLNKIEIPVFDYSQILTLHVWLKQNTFKEKFYGLIDSDVHWIFNKGNYITTVTSDSGKLDRMDKEEILDYFNCEIQKYFPEYNPEGILHYRIVKEKRATFIPTCEVVNKRPQSQTAIKNLFLAGDWINTSLPATIESAVKSGKMAAEAIKMCEQKL